MNTSICISVRCSWWPSFARCLGLYLLVALALPAAAQWETRAGPWRSESGQRIFNPTIVVLDVDTPPRRLLFTSGVLSGESALYRSDDEGLTWHPTPIAGYEHPWVAWAGTLPDPAGAPSQRGDLYITVVVGGYYLGNSRCDLLRSRDAGITWTAVSRNTESCTIVIDPSDTSTFYGVGVGYLAQFHSTIYRSRNGGTSWQYIGASMPFVTRALRAAADGTLYALADVVRVSHDHGTAWSSPTNWPRDGPLPTDTVGPNDLVTWRHPVHGDRFALAATTNGLYRTTDAGVTWAPVGLQDFSINYLDLAEETTDGELRVRIGYRGGLALLRGETLVSLTNGLPSNIDPVPKAGRYAVTPGGLAICKDLTTCAGGTLPQTATLIEYHHTALDHYFLTLDGPEANGIDSGAAGPGWVRTGVTFTVYPDLKATTIDIQPVCRFYGTPGIGPNSHFYTVESLECANVRGDPGWTLESAGAFAAMMPAWRSLSATTMERYCRTGRTVYRLYNNRFAQNDSNHRYVKDLGLYPEMANKGWTGEGARLCVLH